MLPAGNFCRDSTRAAAIRCPRDGLRMISAGGRGGAGGAGRAGRAGPRSLAPAAARPRLDAAEADVELATGVGPVTASRDRFVDLLRAASILIVVLGHWLMAAVSWSDGKVRADNLLTLVPGLQPATWLLQVMPVFFVVGGFANARSWRSARRQGASYADFVRHRVGRLMRPLWPFLAAWVGVAVVVAARGPSSAAVRAMMLIAVQPLWFVGLYVLVVACTPVTLAAHRRWGAWVLAVLVAVAVAVDVVRLSTPGTAWTTVGYVNYAAVWLFAHQLGFFYAGERVDAVARARLWAIAATSLGVLALLTTVGPYPVSMVGLPGDRLSNLAPPTTCVVVLTVWMVSLLLLVRTELTRWVQRPRVWGGVVVVNRVVMSIFLWHLTVLGLLVLGCSAAGLAMPAVASLGWWLLRPVWLAVLALLLVAVVGLVGRFERAPVARRVTAAGAGRRSWPPSGPRGWCWACPGSRSPGWPGCGPTGRSCWCTWRSTRCSTWSTSRSGRCSCRRPGGGAGAGSRRSRWSWPCWPPAPPPPTRGGRRHRHPISAVPRPTS